jgi:hypothetical protein
MTSENYNFYLFAFNHKGGDTKWQTTLCCAELIAENHQWLQSIESCVLHLEDTSNVYNDEVRVKLIRCKTPMEREIHLHMCIIMIETMKQFSPFNYIPTFAWRCAKTSEATVYNFPQCLCLSGEEKKHFHSVFSWIKNFK